MFVGPAAVYAARSINANNLLIFLV